MSTTSISLYAASVPVFKQMLGGMATALSKAEAHALGKKIDANALLQARLYPDMFPLVQQVRIAADFARDLVAPLFELAGHQLSGCDFLVGQLRLTMQLMPDSKQFAAQIFKRFDNGVKADCVHVGPTPEKWR